VQPVEPVVRALVRIAAVLSIVAAASSGQEPQIRVATTLVQVPVLVRDSTGRQVPGLAAGEFEVTDDDVRREISFFERTEQGLRAALVLDTSKSTVTVLPKIRKAAERFVAELGVGDQATVFTCDSEVRRVCRLNADRETLREAVRGVRPGDLVGSRIRDGIRAAAVELAAAGGRRALIVLSDGQDYGSEIPSDSLEGLLAESNVVVYPILYTVDQRELARKLFGVKSRIPRDADDRDIRGLRWKEQEKLAAQFMEELATASGGSFHRIEVSDLKRVFSTIVRELKEQYWLGFYPLPSRRDGELHQIAVRVRREGVSVRHRPSYRIGLPKP
jgi:Ca-activated chloride channel family protein